MVGRQDPPKWKDTAELPDLGEINVGKFWDNCKSRRRCGRPPYDQLLINPVLKADYRTIQWYERSLLQRDARDQKRRMHAEMPDVTLIGATVSRTELPDLKIVHKNRLNFLVF